MRKVNILVGVLAFSVLFISSCQDESNMVIQGNDSNNLDPSLISLLKGGPRPRPQAWVDCELFDGVVTPAHFKPESDPFDELYMGGDGFLNGVPLISESKPGDQDYNGGRWHVNVLKEEVDDDKYVGVCRMEDLDLNDFQSTNVYFECPLLPRRGN